MDVLAAERVQVIEKKLRLEQARDRQALNSLAKQADRLNSFEKVRCCELQAAMHKEKSRAACKPQAELQCVAELAKVLKFKTSELKLVREKLQEIKQKQGVLAERFQQREQLHGKLQHEQKLISERKEDFTEQLDQDGLFSCPRRTADCSQLESTAAEFATQSKPEQSSAAATLVDAGVLSPVNQNPTSAASSNSIVKQQPGSGVSDIKTWSLPQQKAIEVIYTTENGQQLRLLIIQNQGQGCSASVITESEKGRRLIWAERKKIQQALVDAGIELGSFKILQGGKT